MSNLLEKSSILITPTAYSDGKIHAEIPIQSLGVDADLDFIRGSAATRVNAQGLIESSQGINTSRINYENGVGSLLFEPQSTNLLIYSEDFSQSSYIIQSASVSSSTTTDPTGNQNSFKLIPDNGAGGNRSIGNNFTSLTNLHTFSCFGKKAEYNYLMIRTRNGPTNAVMFDLDNGTFNVNATSAAFVSAKIEDYGNDWFRCSVTLDPSQMNTVGQLFVSLSVGVTGDETNSFSGDGVSGVYIFGSQFEELSYATSYIPTSGSIQTRLAERASRSGLSDLINDSEGVLYFEGSALSDDGTARRISLSDNSGNNKIVIGFSDVTDRVTVILKGSGVTSFNNSIVVGNLLSNSKFALKYKENDFALWVNGVEVFTDSLGGTPIGLSALKMSEATGGSKFVGRLKSLGVYKTALTDEELECLTKI